MRERKLFRNLTTLLLAAAVSCFAPSPAGATARITVYGQPGWALGAVLDINKAGLAVGIYDDTGGVRHAFSYRDGVYDSAAPAGWTQTWAWAVDESGRYAGQGLDGAVQKGYVYDGGTYTPLLPPGWSEAIGRNMNDTGTVVGYGNDAGLDKGFLYDIAAGTYTVVNPAGWTGISLIDVNDSGRAVGSGILGGQTTALAWKAGTANDVSPAGWTHSQATGINNAGVIVGYGDSGGAPSCFLNDNGTITILVPPGYIASSCQAINRSGQVLGYASNGTSQDYFIYDRGVYYFFDIEASFAELVSLSNEGIFAGGRYTGVTFEAITGYLFPSTAITANGEEGAVGISPASPLVLRISMTAQNYAGRPVEWWVIAQTATGPWSFDAASRQWLPGLRPAAVSALRDLTGVKLPPVSQAPGLYTYYFGADAFANGRIDFGAFVYDTVTVHIR